MVPVNTRAPNYLPVWGAQCLCPVLILQEELPLQVSTTHKTSWKPEAATKELEICCVDIRNAHKCWWKLEKMNHLGETGRIILKWFSEKYDPNLWNGLKKSELGPITESGEEYDKTPGCTKANSFLLLYINVNHWRKTILCSVHKNDVRNVFLENKRLYYTHFISGILLILSILQIIS
jgi:hypothetical protein